MTANSFGARGTLTAGGADYQIHRLDAVPGAASLPFSLKILLENLLRTEDGVNVTADHVQGAGGLGPDRRAGHRDPVQPGPGDLAGPDRRPGRRGPGHHARGDARRSAATRRRSTRWFRPSW